MVLSPAVSGRHADQSGAPRRRRSALTTALVAVGLTLSAGVISVATGAHAAHATSSLGGPITRSEVIARADYWYQNRANLYYDSSSSAADPQGTDYRTDCSGYVSMAWHLNGQVSTASLPSVATQLTNKDQLLPGDVLDAQYGGGSYSTGHVVIFDGWASPDHTSYVGYEFGTTPVAKSVIPYPYYSDGRDYEPYRYNNIVDDTTTPSTPAPPAPPISASSTVRTSDGTYHVFAINTAHHLMQGLYAGSGWTWQDLTGTVYGTPGVTYQNGRYDVFAPGTNGHMYQKTYNGTSWSGWQDIGGGNFSKGAQAIVTPDGVYHVFATNDYNIVYQGIYSTGAGWTWQSLGGSLVASPAVAFSPGANRYDLFAPGTNGQMYQDTYDGSATWSGWQLRGGGNFSSSPEVVVTPSGSYHVFAINSYNNAYQGLYDGSSWTWQNLNGSVTGTPGVNYVSSANRYDLFAAGLNGQMYQKTYDGTSSWTNWSSIGGSNFS